MEINKKIPQKINFFGEILTYGEKFFQANEEFRNINFLAKFRNFSRVITIPVNWAMFGTAIPTFKKQKTLVYLTFYYDKEKNNYKLNGLGNLRYFRPY